jgi:hypothetical protein
MKVDDCYNPSSAGTLTHVKVARIRLLSVFLPPTTHILQ